jgi:NifU-like protein involved in Fe-S cluster formation
MAPESLSDHFENPRNVGEIDDPDATGRATNPVCGDSVLLTLRIDVDRIVEARFVAFGCHATIAAMSLLTETIRGLAAKVARETTAEGLRSRFDTFPRGKYHAADVAVAALGDALAVGAS